MVRPDPIPFTIHSVWPLTDPPIPPWVLRCQVPINDNDPSRMDKEARERVKEHLDSVVAKWQETDVEYIRCQRLTAALADVETRLAAAAESSAALTRDLEQALYGGDSTTLLDKQLVDLRAEVSFLEGRKAELTRYATSAKNVAEESLRKTIKAAAAAFKAELLKELDAARAKLARVAYPEICKCYGLQVAGDVSDPRTVDDFLVPGVMEALAPPGLAIDRKTAALYAAAKGKAAG
jgi:hypothetical protein